MGRVAKGFLNLIFDELATRLQIKSVMDLYLKPHCCHRMKEKVWSSLLSPENKEGYMVLYFVQITWFATLQTYPFDFLSLLMSLFQGVDDSSPEYSAAFFLKPTWYSIQK